MRTIRTDENRQRILSVLAQGLSYTRGAEAVGIGRTALHAWLNDEPDFRDACLEAIEAGTDRLEDEAVRRAIEGGSDTMLIFLMKGRRRDKWGDKQQIQHSGELITKEQRDALVAAAQVADR
jgi:hypothetical protein